MPDDLTHTHTHKYEGKLQTKKDPYQHLGVCAENTPTIHKSACFYSRCDFQTLGQAR